LGNFSVIVVPAQFNCVYWRELVYPCATEIRVFACPIRFPGYSKQIATQMCLIVMAERRTDGSNFPPVTVIEPENWQGHYYKRKRNAARFSTLPSKTQ
jgi:hypothetical protein